MRRETSTTTITDIEFIYKKYFQGTAIILFLRSKSGSFLEATGSFYGFLFTTPGDT
jgi:hypothetical protein